MKLAIITAHAGASCLGQAMLSWGGVVPVFLQDGKDGMLPAYQRGYQFCYNYDLLAFIHDDVLINDEEWIVRVKQEFEDPTVGLVGFGGALGHGSPSLYREPYDYRQLVRHDFMSNMVDAENHGKRFTGSCDVAVLDGFALIVRREVLGKAETVRVISDGYDREGFHASPLREITHGWPLATPIGYVCYDYWISCITRRLGYRIRLVGVACEHLGGQTFVKLGMGRDEKHWKQYLESHRYIYDEFKDVLPWRAPQ